MDIDCFEDYVEVEQDDVFQISVEWVKVLVLFLMLESCVEYECVVQVEGGK